MDAAEEAPELDSRYAYTHCTAELSGGGPKKPPNIRSNGPQWLVGAGAHEEKKWFNRLLIYFEKRDKNGSLLQCSYNAQRSLRQRNGILDMQRVSTVT